MPEDFTAPGWGGLAGGLGGLTQALQFIMNKRLREKEDRTLRSHNAATIGLEHDRVENDRQFQRDQVLRGRVDTFQRGLASMGLSSLDPEGAYTRYHTATGELTPEFQAFGPAFAAARKAAEEHSNRHFRNVPVEVENTPFIYTAPAQSENSSYNNYLARQEHDRDQAFQQALEYVRKAGEGASAAVRGAMPNNLLLAPGSQGQIDALHMIAERMGAARRRAAYSQVIRLRAGGINVTIEELMGDEPPESEAQRIVNDVRAARGLAPLPAISSPNSGTAPPKADLSRIAIPPRTGPPGTEPPKADLSRIAIPPSPGAAARKPNLSTIRIP